MRKKAALEMISSLEKELRVSETKLNTLSVQYEKMLNDYKVAYSALEASQKRIKELSEERDALAAEVEMLRNNNAKLCEQNEEYRAEAIIPPKYEAPISAEDNTPPTILPTEGNVAATEATIKQPFVKISEIEKFGSNAIGNVVVEATKIIGELSGKATPNAKDTLALVLGRTEVLKSEVLAIVQSADLEDEEKKQRIRESRDQAIEYLASVAAQE